MSSIYVIKKDNIPVYVGQTTRDPKIRWEEYQHTANRNNSHIGYAIHSAMRKYGLNHFSFEIIENIIDNTILNEREKYWIKKLQTHISQSGYNLTWGGEQCSDLEKVQCFQYDLKGKYIQSFNSLADAAKSCNGNYTNIIKAINGEIRTAYGFRWSRTQIKQLPKIQNNYTGSPKKVYQFDLQGNFLHCYNSTHEAAKMLGKSQGNISMAANGRRKTAYGFKWSYKKAGY